MRNICINCRHHIEYHKSLAYECSAGGQDCNNPKCHCKFFQHAGVAEQADAAGLKPAEFKETRPSSILGAGITFVDPWDGQYYHQDCWSGERIEFIVTSKSGMNYHFLIPAPLYHYIRDLKIKANESR